MHKIDLTENRDFLPKRRLPVLFRTPWKILSEISPPLPWQSRIITTCECCGRTLKEELPWRKGRGELCHECDHYLEVTIDDKLSDITAPITHSNHYDTIFLSEYL